MAAGIRLLDSDSEITRKVMSEWAGQLNVRLPAVGIKLQRWIRNEVKNRISNSETVKSLLGGQLKKVMGVDNPDIVATFISTYSLLLNVKTYPVTLIGSGMMSKKPLLSLMSEDLETLTNENQLGDVTRNGDTLKIWNWLCFQGDRIIVRDFYYNPKPNSFFLRFHSRAGGQMQNKKSSQWRVPPEWSGIDGNNFITKALDGLDIEIEQFINRELS